MVAGPLQFWRVQSRWDHFDGRDTQLADHEISELLWAFGLQRGSAPKNKADTLEGVLDLKQAVERAASLGVALTSEQMAAINAKRDDEDEVASMVMAAFKAFDAAGKRSGTYVVGKDEEGALQAERIKNNWPFPP